MIKPRARLKGAWVEEAHNSQRLFFISKELKLNTKFHYMEVTATSENYKISLCISKITVKQKSFFTSAYTLSRKKNHKKEKEKEKEKKRECEREGEREREEEKEKEKEKEEKEEERKNGESGTRSFFKYTAPSGYVP